MVLTRQEKEEVLEKLISLLEGSKASIASNYSGLKAQEITKLRKELKQRGIDLIVTKNTLVKIALEKSKLNLNQSILDQPVIFAFGDDEVETCKALYQFSKENENLKILGGIVLREETGKEKIVNLALLPSREELEGKLVRVLSGPIYGLVNVLFGNIKGLASVLNQYKEKIS